MVSELAMPLADAVKRISTKTPVGAKLSSREWEDVPLALRERSMFAARIESLRFLHDVRAKLQKSIGMVREKVARGDAFVDRSSFIADMRKIAQEEGIPVDPAKRGGLQDITSRKRLGMIYDMQRQSALEYARWKAEQDPDVLDAFPAQELIRTEDRSVPRKWRERWVAAGGELIGGGRMVALKGDPIWRKISRFGTPWPPFDYQSGMGLEDVSREEAEALGLLGPDDVPPVQEVGFNEDLEASVRGLDDKERAGLVAGFGDQVVIQGDKAMWRGNLITDLFDRAMAEKDFKGSVSLGKAWPRAVEAAKEAGEDIAGYEFELLADDIRHAVKKHGGQGETARGQRPIERSDFELLPLVLREPDVVGLGDKPDTIGMTKRYRDQAFTFWLLRSRKNRIASFKTLYVRREKK
ncbi:MAG: hypothetical protein Fur0032_20960 [Terrimicrobiaceae bacterium]